MFKHLKRWYRRYFKTLEFCPRCHDMVISICYEGGSTIRLIYRDLGFYVRRSVQLNEHGLLSSRYRLRQISDEQYQYSCLILSSRTVVLSWSVNDMFNRLKRWYRRYFKTHEFRPRTNDSLISVIHANIFRYFVLKLIKLADKFERNVYTSFKDIYPWTFFVSTQLNEHGHFSGRRCYRSIDSNFVEYSCLIFSSRGVDITRVRWMRCSSV